MENKHFPRFDRRPDFLREKLVCPCGKMCDSCIRETAGKLAAFWKLIREYVSVEPVLFLYVFGLGLLGPTNEALVYRKICIARYFDRPYICDNLHNSSKEVVDLIQSDTSHFFFLESLCFTIPAIFSASFYGALSDKISRKFPIVLPMIGQVLSAINLAFNAAYSDAPYQLLLLGTITSALFGGFITCILGVFSYLTEVSTRENRTTRIAITESMIAVGFAISGSCSGILLDNTSFLTVYTISISIYIFGIFFTLVWLKDFKNVQKPNAEVTNTSICKKICDVDNMIDSVRCVFKKRENGARKYILIQLFAICTLFIGNGSRSLTFLFLRRKPLEWDQTTYGFFRGISAATHGLCLLVVVPVLKTVFKISDSVLAIVAVLSSGLGEALFSLCTVTWMVFLVPFVSMASPASMASMRSMMSTMVNQEEQGKLFSVIASMESASILIASTLYTNLYPVTLKFWAGFCFALGACLVLIPFSLLIWLHIELKREAPYNTLQEETCKTPVETIESLPSEKPDTTESLSSEKPDTTESLSSEKPDTTEQAEKSDSQQTNNKGLCVKMSDMRSEESIV